MRASQAEAGGREAGLFRFDIVDHKSNFHLFFLSYELGDRETASNSLQALEGVWRIHVSWDQRRRLENPPPLQLANDGDVLGADLADEQWLQLAAVGKIIENLLQATQVHHILGQTATPESAHGDDEGCPLGETVGVVKFPERLDKGGAVDEVGRRDHPSREKSQPRAAQTADEVFGEDGQTLLEGVVPGQAGIEMAQRLDPAVVVREDVGADFVLDQSLNP